MLTNLLASKPRKQRTAGVMMLSLITHIVIMVAATYATLQAVTVVKEKREEDISFVEAPKNEPPPPVKKIESLQPKTVRLPKGFQVLTAPIKIPDVLPEIDPTKSLTNEKDFTGVGVQGGIGSGVGNEPVNRNQPYDVSQVDKTVTPVDKVAPRYPEMLRSAGIEGEVLVQFVVDTMGRADMSTFKVVRSTNDMFTNAVRNALSNTRFYPAEKNGMKVRQTVQQPFAFNLRR